MPPTKKNYRVIKSITKNIQITASAASIDINELNTNWNNF